jgi:hypothetical protein
MRSVQISIRQTYAWVAWRAMTAMKKRRLDRMLTRTLAADAAFY